MCRQGGRSPLFISNRVLSVSLYGEEEEEEAAEEAEAAV